MMKHIKTIEDLGFTDTVYKNSRLGFSYSVSRGNSQNYKIYVINSHAHIVSHFVNKVDSGCYIFHRDLNLLWK